MGVSLGMSREAKTARPALGVWRMSKRGHVGAPAGSGSDCVGKDSAEEGAEGMLVVLGVLVMLGMLMVRDAVASIMAASSAGQYAQRRRVSVLDYGRSCASSAVLVYGVFCGQGRYGLSSLLAMLVDLLLLQPDRVPLDTDRQTDRRSKPIHAAHTHTMRIGAGELCHDLGR